MINSHLSVSRLCRFVSVAMLAVASSIVCAQTTDSTFYGVSKELHYVQNSAAAPVLETGTPALFSVSLDAAGSFRTPAGVTTQVQADVEFRAEYASRAAMDAAYPDGTYTLTIGGTNIPVALGSTYPSAPPQVLNGTWNAQGRLVIDPTRDVTIEFNPNAGWGSTGVMSYAYFSLWEGDGDDIVAVNRISTEEPGPVNSVTIPARTLVAGHVYNVEVFRFHAAVLDRTARPGKYGYAGNGAQTTFQIAATNPANSAPVIATQPASLSIASGNSAVFSVNASGMPAPTYQWRRAGTNIAGATSSTLVLTGANASAGAYTCVVTNSVGNVTTNAANLTVDAAAPANVGRLINLSIRTTAGTGAQTLIVGLATGGAGTSGPKPLLIRGVGPALGQFGLGGTLADPVMTVFQGSTTVATNDNWGGDAQVAASATQVGAFSYASNSSLDAALALSPNAGAYTVQIVGKNNGTGVALAEIYDATAAGAFTATTPRLVNVSARTQVGVGGGILITGFVIGGTTAKTVLIRAVGPTLTAFGVTGVLEDPKLQLFSGTTLVRENDNWGGDAQLAAASTSVGAFPLANAASKDAVILVTLPPGSYTAQVSGLNLTTGVALVEVYEVP